MGANEDALTQMPILLEVGAGQRAENLENFKVLSFFLGLGAFLCNKIEAGGV